MFGHLEVRNAQTTLQQPPIIFEIMESLRPYCVRFSQFAIGNNGVGTVNDQSLETARNFDSLYGDS